MANIQKKKTKQTDDKKQLKTKIITFVLLCAIFALSFIFTSPIEKWINYKYNDILSANIESSDIQIHFIDVGQGDSIAIRFSDNTKMLIDAGTSSSKQDLVNYLNNNFFLENEQKKFDYFVITHPHEDHIGGAPLIFETYDVEFIYRPRVYAKDEAHIYGEFNQQTSLIYKQTIEALYSEITTNNAVDSTRWAFNNADNSNLNIGNCTIDFLTPNQSGYDNLNNYSPIMLLSYDGRKVMLTGDAEALCEEEAMEHNLSTNFDVDILKLGHHGSSTSTSNGFLEATKPEYVVISVGAGNKYNHPSQSTITKLENFGITENNIFRTDISSNIVFGIQQNTDGDGLISVSVNYTPSMGIYIKLIYIYAGFVVVLFIIIFVPKKIQKKLKKLSKSR